MDEKLVIMDEGSRVFTVQSCPNHTDLHGLLFTFNFNAVYIISKDEYTIDLIHLVIKSSHLQDRKLCSVSTN